MRGFRNLGLLGLSLWILACNSGSNGAPGASNSATSSNLQSPNTYLLLVNTAIARLLTDQDFQVFEGSSYNGLAVAWWHAYDTSPPNLTATMDSDVTHWKTQAPAKHVWPWLYINRMLEMDPSFTHEYDSPYFHQFVGLDFNDTAGARTDFITNWTNSVQTAHDSGVPGVVLDLEFYNYYGLYHLEKLAALLNQDLNSTVIQLEGLGAQIADTAAAVYPNAILWLLFTGVNYTNFTVSNGQNYLPTPAYISLGILQEIQKQNLGLQVIDGGEAPLGYCPTDLPSFQTAIDKRAVTAPSVSGYPFFQMGGTMTLFSDQSAKQGYAALEPCLTMAGGATAVEQLGPYIQMLLDNYKYNFIWADSADMGYYAFDPNVAPRFDAVISQALQNFLALHH